MSSCDWPYKCCYVSLLRNKWHPRSLQLPFGNLLHEPHHLRHLLLHDETNQWRKDQQNTFGLCVPGPCLLRTFPLFLHQERKVNRICSLHLKGDEPTLSIPGLFRWAWYLALPWCGGSLFRFPLHFHSGRRCPQPKKGLNQSLLKEERNLLTKHRFSGYVSATRGGTPSNSFEGSINLLVF